MSPDLPINCRQHSISNRSLGIDRHHAEFPIADVPVACVMIWMLVYLGLSLAGRKALLLSTSGFNAGFWRTHSFFILDHGHIRSISRTYLQSLSVTQFG